MRTLIPMSSPAAALLWVALAMGAAQAQSASPDGGAENRAANFQAGYGDGCATAQSNRIMPKVRRDQTAFQVSDSYRNGWRQGFDSCHQQGGAEVPNRLLGRPFDERW